jgi:hypothetical protein
VDQQADHPQRRTKEILSTCLKGLDRFRIGYVRYDNSLLRTDDLETAAKLCEHFAHRAWPRVLNAFARLMNPMMPVVRAANYGGYYWVIDQAEIATDVMFKSRPQLLEIWPDLVHHAALNMSSEDVLGFFGRKLHPSLAAEVVTDAKRRPERWRVRHRMGPNWVKMYDKASVLRVETVINNPREFRILRTFQDDAGRRERRWCPMRKGVCDLYRNFQVGMGANQRYLHAVAAVPLKGEGVAALDALCRPKTKRGRTVARFSPLSPADLGRLIGHGMARRNGDFSRWVVGEVRKECANEEIRIVELGPGPGIGLQEMLRVFPAAQVLGVDLSAEMLSQSQKRNLAAVRAKRLSLIEGDTSSLTQVAPIDIIVANHVLYFWHGAGG